VDIYRGNLLRDFPSNPAMTLRNIRAACWLVLTLTLGGGGRAAPEPAAPKDRPTQPAPPPPDLPPFLVAPATANATEPAANPPVPKPRPRLSTRITSQLAPSIPPWSPPPPKPAEKDPPPPPDPDVVRMAPVIVRDYRLPRIEEKEWLTKKALSSKLVNEYLPPFDRNFLNRFTLPIVGISPEARARMMYEEDQRLRDLRWMNNEIEQTKLLDPEAAKELKHIRNSTFTRPGE
jgi:hypothetical protein